MEARLRWCRVAGWRDALAEPPDRRAERAHCVCAQRESTTCLLIRLSSSRRHHGATHKARVTLATGAGALSAARAARLIDRPMSIWTTGALSSAKICITVGVAAM